MNQFAHLTTTALLILCLLPTGCSEDQANVEAPSGHQLATPTTTNRIAIPPSVRSNLGITFAPAERRRIEDTLRAPGTFEYQPTATREYRTMLPGRVDVLVNQFDRVEPGAPLYRLDSPDWRDIQRTIAESESTVKQLQATLNTFGPLLSAHKRHEQSLQESIDVWEARVEKLNALREAGGGRMSEFTAAQSSLAKAQAELANMQEKDAELTGLHAQSLAATHAAQINLDLSIDAAAALLDIDRATLLAPASPLADAKPLWRTITSIEVTARSSGVVESVDLTNGAWADERANVVTIVQPDQLRFHASGLQSDLGVLRDGLRVTIVPPTPTAGGTAVPMQDVMRGTLTLGLAGDSK
ncbi:MAG: efflux RND transporter periplasmic adaptor subunit, partial [Phycisphaerales bacterium]|nr:efflux RND transporter periplasmic adaptor subunit [Phycisphaerales bacterium]